MAVIDWWNGPLTLVVIFFALCLLLLTWSIASVACRACHSSGTFFHCDTHTHKHVHTQISFSPFFFLLSSWTISFFFFPFFSNKGIVSVLPRTSVYIPLLAVPITMTHHTCPYACTLLSSDSCPWFFVITQLRLASSRPSNVLYVNLTTSC